LTEKNNHSDPSLHTFVRRYFAIIRYLDHHYIHSKITRHQWNRSQKVKRSRLL